MKKNAIPQPMSYHLTITTDQWAYCEAEAQRLKFRSGGEYIVALIKEQMEADGIVAGEDGAKPGVFSGQARESNVCPQCRSSSATYKGKDKGRDRWSCKSCGHQYVSEAKYIRVSDREAARATARAMHEQGKSQAEIMTALGLTRTTLWRYLKKDDEHL